MTADRFGVTWGLAGGVALSSIAQAREAARFANDSGFDGFWISHANAVDSVLACACIAPEIPDLTEVGTSVVPLYGRHPIGLAQLAQSAQTVLGGRFTLGVGASSKAQVAEAMGLDWRRPLEYTREFIDGLEPLLSGRAAAVEGAQLTTNNELNIDAPETSILLAALGPRMLELAGARTAGTSVGQCGPRTIASYIAPTIAAAAEAADRPSPRIMALVRVNVTDDVAGARELATATAAQYRASPSYAAVQDREGLDDLADLHLIGSWERVLDGLAAYAGAGVTDLRIELAAHTEEARRSSQEAFAHYLAPKGQP